MFFFPLILCHPVGLQPGPLTYIQLLTQAVIKVTSLHASTTLTAHKTGTMAEYSWNSGVCVSVFESVKVMLPSVRGLLTDSAAELSSAPNFAQRRPPDLPVWKR